MATISETDDGIFEFIMVTSERMEDAINIIRKSYYIDETMLKAIEFNKCPSAIKDFEVLLVKFLEEGNSIIAIEKSTGKAACVCINALQITNDAYFDNYIEKLKDPLSKFLANYMNELDNSCNLFALSKNKCLFEILFASTLLEYRGRGLCKKMFDVSIKVAKNLYNKQENSTEHDLTQTPDVVTSFCSSSTTKNIATSLGFDKYSDINLNQWSFEGKTTGERLGIENPIMTVYYMQL